MAATDDTRQRLLEAAGEIFAELGRDAPIRKILQKAGIKNIAAVNYYFGDKDQLYEEVLRSSFDCQPPQLMAPLPAGLPAPVKLYLFIRAFARHVAVPQQPSWQMRLLMKEVAQPTAGGDMLVRQFIRPMYERLWALLREVLGPEIPEDRLHLIGFSIVGQCVYHRVGAAILRRVVGDAEYGTYDSDRLADHIAAFSLAALGLPVPRAEEVPT
jgi:TetR/AcrR family transcriptional regulator, regulator of cefoperazone and chloramphenicol sensitivity